jgi:ssRNA-specific RNase YbeY (16S rRNA maturation enzyme)
MWKWKRGYRLVDNIKLMKVAAYITFLMLLGICGNGYCQPANSKDSFYVNTLSKYLRDHIRYPAIARENNTIGQVFISFRFNEDKTISDIKILKDLPDGCSDEVIRVLKGVTFLNIKPDEYTFSVNFRIENGDDIQNDPNGITHPEKELKNYLFGVNITGFGTIKHVDYIIDRTYIIPAFDDHLGKLKSLTINKYKAGKNGIIHPDSIDSRTVEIFDKKGNLIQNLAYDSKGNLLWKTKYVYSHTGDQTKLEYRGNGELFYKQVLKYDSLGRKTQEALYNTKTDSINNKTIFEYNDKGLVALKTTYNNKNTITNKLAFKYNEKGEQVEEDRYDVNKNAIGAKTLTYYTNGNVTEDREFGTDGVLSFKHINKYDDQNHVTEQALYSPDGNVLYRDTFKYDAKGNKIEDTTDGKISTFVYNVYDKQGNWHKAKWTDGHQPKLYIIERGIVYYH